MNKIHLGITVFLRHNTECRNHGVNVMLIEHFGNRWNIGVIDLHDVYFVLGCKCWIVLFGMLLDCLEGVSKITHIST